jgi:hypothetical protein
MVKNSTHPLRPFDSNNWKSKSTFTEMLSTIYIHVYNGVLGLLGLTMMGYSAFLINKHNSPFAKLLMCVSAYMVLTSLFGWAAPYILPIRNLCAPIWFGLNALLCLFCIGLFILSFFPSFFETIIRMDSAALKRSNQGIFALKNIILFNITTILGAFFSALAILSLGYLYYTWMSDVNVPKTAYPIVQRPENVELNRPNRAHV